MRIELYAGLLLCLVACTPSGGGAGDPDPVDGATVPDGAADMDPAQPDAAPVDAAPADAGCVDDCGAPPRILTLDANVRRLTEGGQIRISAVVTDPDGADDLLGGVLETADGAPYGPFEAAGDVGTYGFTLTWAEIQAIAPITFDGEAGRTLVAAFFDQAGNRTTGEIALVLHCDDAGGAACDGVCVSLDSAEHCGACDAACATACVDRACACPDGLSRCGADCVDLAEDITHCGGCDRACPGIDDGEAACVDGGCRFLCADDHQLCDPEAPVCAPCPTEGVARVTCDGRACVAAQCADGFERCGAACTQCPVEDAVETLCLGDRCVAAACAPGTHPCSEGCCPWRRVGVAEVAPSHGLAVDAAGVHVVIGREGGVEHRRLADGAWVEQMAVVFAPGERVAAQVDLTRADDGLHAVYAFNEADAGGAFRSVVGHLQLDGDGWAERADFPAAGPAFGPVIRGRGDAVWLGFTRGGPQVIDAAGQAFALFEGAGSDMALGLGPDGAVHVAAQEQFGSDLLYAARGDGGFEEDDPVNGALGGAGPRVAVDRDGLPVILHRAAFDGSLWVTRSDGRVWRTDPILRGFTSTDGLDLIAGADGRLVGCAGTQLGLHVFYEEAGGWRADEVANGNHFVCRLALGPDGALYVAALGPGGLLLYR